MEQTEINVGRSGRQLGLPTVVLDSQADALLAALAEPGGALVITGASGSGKSALVNKAFRRLRADGWAVAANIGRWFPRDVFWASAGALSIAGDDFPRGTELEAALLNGSDNDHLDALCELLATTPFALAFDDLGQNLDDDGFIDPGFGAVFARLCAAADRGRVIATCRQRLPGGAGVSVRYYHHEPTLRDAVQLATQLSAMSQLEQNEQATVIALLSGLPRLMGLANTWLNAGGDSLADAYLDLLVQLADAHSASWAGRGREASSEPACSAPDNERLDRLRANLIDLHLRLVRPEQLELLLQAALSTFPITTRLLAAACGLPQEAADEASDRLQGLHLVTGVNQGELLVEPWIAAGLRGYQGANETERHERAMRVHNAEMRDRRNTYVDVVAITRHLAAVGDQVDLTSFTLAATPASAGSLAAAALLGEVVPAVPVDHPDLPDLVERQIARLRDSNLNDAARQAAERFRARVRRWAEPILASEPASDQADDELRASVYDRLGDAARLAGDSDEAEERYRLALAPRQRRFEAVTNADTLRAMCRSFERLADLVRDSGDLAAAERFYRTRLAAAEAMVRTNPDDDDIAQEYRRARQKLADLLGAAS